MINEFETTILSLKHKTLIVLGIRKGIKILVNSFLYSLIHVLSLVLTQNQSDSRTLVLLGYFSDQISLLMISNPLFIVIMNFICSLSMIKFSIRKNKNAVSNVLSKLLINT